MQAPLVRWCKTDGSMALRLIWSRDFHGQCPRKNGSSITIPFSWLRLRYGQICKSTPREGIFKRVAVILYFCGLYLLVPVFLFRLRRNYMVNHFRSYPWKVAHSIFTCIFLTFLVSKSRSWEYGIDTEMWLSRIGIWDLLHLEALPYNFKQYACNVNSWDCLECRKLTSFKVSSKIRRGAGMDRRANG